MALKEWHGPAKEFKLLSSSFKGAITNFHGQNCSLGNQIGECGELEWTILDLESQGKRSFQ